jgi:hypothetical protein
VTHLEDYPNNVAWTSIAVAASGGSGAWKAPSIRWTKRTPTAAEGTMMAEHSGKLEREHIWDDLPIRGRNVVAAIDFHRTRIYPTNTAPGQSPEQVADVDPQGHAREISHKAGNPDGSYEGQPGLLARNCGGVAAGRRDPCAGPWQG